jgi:hypothetical protein
LSKPSDPEKKLAEYQGKYFATILSKVKRD